MWCLFDIQLWKHQLGAPDILLWMSAISLGSGRSRNNIINSSSSGFDILWFPSWPYVTASVSKHWLGQFPGFFRVSLNASLALCWKSALARSRTSLYYSDSLLFYLFIAIAGCSKGQAISSEHFQMGSAGYLSALLFGYCDFPIEK